MIFVILLICALSLNVYAYSSDVSASVSPDGSGIYFYSRNYSNASPANIRVINHYAEYSWMGVILATSNYGDTQHRYNSLSSHYNYNNARYGVYSSSVHGVTEYMPPITYRDTPSTSSSYEKPESLAVSSFSDSGSVENFLDELGQTIFTAFGTDLKVYRKIDTMNTYSIGNDDDLELLDIRKQIPLQYGDSVPSVYLNAGNTQGIALKQDLNGVYYLYSFEYNLGNDSDSSWVITSTKTVQGEYKAISPTVTEYFAENPNPPTYSYMVDGDSIRWLLKTLITK